MKNLLKSKKRGSAIPLTVVAIIILLAMGVGLLGLGFNSRVYTIRNASVIKARCAADAGLAMALFEMNQKYGEFFIKPAILLIAEKFGIKERCGLIGQHIFDDRPR